MWSSEQEISVSDLKLGMYIARLDRPWSGTSFPIQGFLIKEPDDIARVASYCKKVYIDVYKSRNEAPIINCIENGAKKQKQRREAAAKANKNSLARHTVEKYQVTSSFKREVAVAYPVLRNLEVEVKSLLSPGGYLNKYNIKQVLDSTSDLVASVIRNPDAMVWLCRVQNDNSMVYQHSLRLAILGCLVGRQFGLNRFLLIDLTMALLLTSIGKSLIENAVLMRFRLDSVPDQYKRHLQYTMERIIHCKLEGVNVAGIIANYCERMDGSGYPNGKSGDAIPLLARIAGLIEYFEIQVNPFNRKYAKSPSDAITELNRVKDKLFDASIVEKFVQTIGIYPTGTLVELNDDRIAIVCSQSYEKRLRASVIPLTTRRGDIVEEYNVLDLSFPNQWQLNDGKTRIQQGLPINSLPIHVVEAAHDWLLKKNYGAWGKVKNIMWDLCR